jgi:hypothetical protein
MKPQAVILAVCVGIGFGYATLGLVSLVSSTVWGARLWWLEVTVALIASMLVARGFLGVQNRQTDVPRVDRGERAIWRLSYRRGQVLSLEQIVQETLLDEGSALAALRSLEAQGQARLENDGRWRLLEP